MSCGSECVERVFNFGKLPPVNTFFLPNERREDNFNELELNVCKSCWLLQLSKTPHLNEMFREYHYLSSASLDTVAHLKDVGDFLIERFPHAKKVLEIGCNDCTLLNILSQNFNQCIGIDPAKNLRRETQCYVYEDYFNDEFADKIFDEFGVFDIVVGLNVFAHNSDCVGMLRGVATTLNQNGIALIEVAYAVDTIINGNYDTIYHEHVCSFSFHSLQKCIELAGLKIVDVENLKTQGGSLRILASHKNNSSAPSKNVKKLLQKEVSNGVNNITLYRNLSANIERKISAIEEFIKEKNSNKERVLLVGAPARGVVLLNTATVCFTTFVRAVDDTPEKLGRLIPGTNIPVIGWADLIPSNFDVALVLSWNYQDLMASKLLKSGFQGPVFVPLPEFQMYEKHEKVSSP